MRLWAGDRGGQLGWVPLGLYGTAADSLANWERDSAQGPIAIGPYYVLARVHMVIATRVPPFTAVRSRVRRDWAEANQQRLLEEWMQELRRTTYPTRVDTSLLARLPLRTDNADVSPATPDSASIETLPANQE